MPFRRKIYAISPGHRSANLLSLDLVLRLSIGVLPMRLLIYYDNVSAVYLSSNPVQHQRTKHIEIDIHFVRDLVATGAIRVLHVPSRYQYADIFTKGLPTSLFDEFRTSLRVRSSPASTARGSRGVVGRALSSRGSCFCGDVTKLGEEEYSFDFTSCFAIFLHSIEHDAEFVLEFFLPIAMKEDADLQNLVKLSLAIQPDIIHTSLTAELVELELLTEGENSSQIECTNAQDERDSGNDYYNLGASHILENTISVEEGCGSVEKNISLKPRRKQKLQSFSLETLQQYFKMPIGEASRSLDDEWASVKDCFPNGLPPAPPQKNKEKLTEVVQQLKKAEATERRTMQNEKAARESEREETRA
ncbi:ribonuclease H-like domain-containing protein [Tanacetum coccineum]